MLHLLARSFLWLTGLGSGVLPPAPSEVLDGGVGLSDGPGPFLYWDAMLYQVSPSHALVVPTEHILVLV